MTELWQLGALDIGRRIAEGQCSAVEVLEAHLARVEEINPQVNASRPLTRSDRGSQQPPPTSGDVTAEP